MFSEWWEKMFGDDPAFVDIDKKEKQIEEELTKGKKWAKDLSKYSKSRTAKEVIKQVEQLASSGRKSVVSAMEPLTGREDPTPAKYDLYETIYISVPDIYQGVNTTADNAIIGGFEIEGDQAEEVKKLLDSFGFTELLLNISKQMLIFGNAYLEVGMKGKEVSGLFLLHPKQISIKRKSDGTIEKYIQTDANSNAHDLDAKKIVHFVFNKIADNPYGIGLIQPLATIIEYKLNMEKAVASESDNYAEPILHFKFGTPERPWNKTKITKFLDDFTPTRRMGTGGDVSLELITPQNQLNSQAPLAHFENQILAGIQVPDCLLGRGQGTTEATARVELQGFDRRVQSLRLDLSNPIDNILIPIILGKVEKKASDKVEELATWLKWPLTTSQEADIAKEMIELVGAGIVSPEFAREKLQFDDPAAGKIAPQSPAQAGVGKLPVNKSPTEQVKPSTNVSKEGGV